MPDDDDKTLQLRALVALDQERGRTDDLSFAFLTEYKARVRAEQKLREMEGLDALVIAELREQLGVSEQMRATISAELQQVRGAMMEMRLLAEGAVIEEANALFELMQLGYLSQTGIDRLNRLQQWITRHGTQQQGALWSAPPA